MMTKKWKWASMVPRVSSTSPTEQKTSPPVAKNDAHRRCRTTWASSRQASGVRAAAPMFATGWSSATPTPISAGMWNRSTRSSSR